MTKKVKKINKLPYIMLVAIAVCFTLMLGVLFSATPVYAYSQVPSSVTSSTNLNFSYNGNTTSIYTSPTGWTKGLNNNDTTSGAINLNYYNDSFNITKDQIPSKIMNADDHVLMINSKTSSTSSKPAVQYYTNTSSFALNAYSSYRIKVYVQVTDGARASIYVDGLSEELNIENINYEMASEWTAYTFYISTGLEPQSIKLQLWLGSKPNYTSTGAVFFDNIEFTQISENEITTDARSKVLDLDKSTLLDGINANFETNSLSDWSKISEMTIDSYAEIINLSNANECQAKQIEYVGTDLSKDNQNAFVLYTKNDKKSYFGYKSKSIDLNMYEIVKISVNAKTANLDGSAYIKIVENDVVNFSGNKVEAITPNSKSITISSNEDNKFQNDYTTYTFYIKGRSLYNTSFNIELWLGSEETPASGLVAFDNIKIEYISYSDYTSASTSSSAVKMPFDSDPAKFNISNSAFNDVQKSEKELTYPLLPNNWTQSASNDNDVIFGVINTNESIYNKNDFAGFANPENPNGFGSIATDTNNILVMQNVNKAYQTVKSNSFNVDSNAYYKLTFDYKVLETSSDRNIFNVYVQDENSNTLYANEKIANTDGTWKTYTLYINTKAYTNTLNLILGVGLEDNLVNGIAYIDNVMLVKDENMTDTDYEELAKNSNVLDFQQGNFNLVKYDKDGIFTPLRYTESLENVDSASSGLASGFGGIIDASNQDDAYDIEKSPNSDSALNYIMLIQTMNKATYSLTAKDSLSLSSDTYHKFSIDIKTQGLTSGLDYDNKYGAIFAISGLDEKLEGIVADDWTTYTIYVACTSSVTVNVKFALASLDDATSGNAYFDNFTYEVIDKDTYNLAKLNQTDETNLFIGNTDEKEEDNDNSSKTNLDYIWYVIPTLIMAVALILALVAYLMKKVKIKKWEKRKINEYDRDKTVHRDVIRAEAEKRRDADIKQLKREIEELEKEKQHIDEVHQEQLKASRASRAKGVSKAEEREFKQYAKMYSALENRIANINKQIDKMNSAEYLLSVQHQIMLEKAKNERLAKEKAYSQDKKAKNSKNKKNS